VRVEIKGSGFLWIVFIVFVTLKLTGAIDWSWWWVTAPLWAPFGLAFVIVSVYLVCKQVSRLFKR
jgi:hypothetical protein